MAGTVSENPIGEMCESKQHSRDAQAYANNGQASAEKRLYIILEAETDNRNRNARHKDLAYIPEVIIPLESKEACTKA